MSLKSMNDSAVFNYLNDNNRINNTIVNILTKGTVLSVKNIEQAYVTMKMYKYPLRAKVLEAVDQGRVTLLFAPKDLKMTPALPFFLQKSSNGATRAVVLVDIYGSMDEAGNVTIDPKKLYTVLEAAYLGLVYSNEYNSIAKRTGVITNGSAIYCNMFARVLNRKYALNTDKVKLHKVQFLASKFFLINILGNKDGETITNYALKNCVGANTIILRDLDDQVPEEAYTNLNTFIKTLTRPELHLNFGDSLTVRSYIEQYIMMYDQSALLALELFPYFILTVNAVNSGAYLNNQLILEDIIDKNGIKLYQDMLTVSRV